MFKDGSVSEEEAKFFLAGNEEFTLDSFKDTGFVLLKPYLELEEPEEPATTEHPAPEQELVEPTTEEFTPPPPSQEDPQVYDPWRANQQKEEKVHSAPILLLQQWKGNHVDIDEILQDHVEEPYEQEVDEYDDGEDEDKDDEEDYDIADTPPQPTEEPKVQFYYNF